MWEVELRTRIGALRIPLWQTTEQGTVDPVVDRLKQRLKRAGTARSPSVRQLGASWLHYDLIDYMTSLVSKPYYACMVCYSDEDRDFSDRFYADLRTNGVRAWYFRKDAKWGEPVWGEIDRIIKSYDKVVVICSENSLQSGPVLREIDRALQREDREGKNILFPIRIDDYIFDRWEHPRKADVVNKVVGDFRGWEQNADKYEAAFEKLLEALEAEG